MLTEAIRHDIINELSMRDERTVKKSLKKFLTERCRCDNLVWLSQKSRDAERQRKNFLKKYLTSEKQCDKMLELSNDRNLDN